MPEVSAPLKAQIFHGHGKDEEDLQQLMWTHPHVF